ncbi:MAG: ABC transporter permease, partial [Bdellovibrionales bacterium]|nr:ABC transporter permease [Bdellovibrionales bacterium]
ASVSEKSSTTTTIANVIFFPLIFISNIFFPAQNLPDFLKVASQYSPLQATADLFRAVILNGASLGDHLQTVGLLLTIFVVFILGSARFFKWK